MVSGDKTMPTLVLLFSYLGGDIPVPTPKPAPVAKHTVALIGLQKKHIPDMQKRKK